MLNIPIPRDGDEVPEKNLRVKWLLDKSFQWRRGAIELGTFGHTYYMPNYKLEGNKSPSEFINQPIPPANNWHYYELHDIDTLKAFSELALCVGSSVLVGGEQRDSNGDAEGGKKGRRQWLYKLYPQNYDDFPSVKQWIEKYGFPLPTSLLENSMSDTDALVIANLVSLAWRLFGLSKTKTGRAKIRGLANACIFNDVTKVTFGLPQREVRPEDYEGYILFPEDLIIHVPSNKPEKWPNDTWRKIAYLWIGRLCGYFIDVQIDTKFSSQIRKIQPVLEVKTFLSWLWLHFLVHISEELKQTKEKRCDCGEAYDSRAKFCPKCTRERKLNFMKEYTTVKKFQNEGKTAEETSTLTGWPLERVKELYEGKKTKKGGQI